MRHASGLNESLPVIKMAESCLSNQISYKEMVRKAPQSNQRRGGCSSSYCSVTVEGGGDESTPEWQWST